VLVVGDQLPGWAVGVDNLRLDRQSSRFEDAEENIRAGLAQLGGWAYIMHDDMIVSRPVMVIFPSNRGLLASYRGGGAYYQRARHTATWLIGQGIATPVNFNIHLPFLVNADSYLTTVSAAPVPAGFGLSVYGNLMGLRTRKVIDPKVTHPAGRPHPSWPVWSMSDRSFRQGLIGRTVRTLLPTPGPYER
jgi:hypothetical protein